MPIGNPDYLINSKGLPNILSKKVIFEKSATRLSKPQHTMLPQFNHITFRNQKTDLLLTKFQKDTLNSQISNSNRATSLPANTAPAISVCRDKHSCNQQIKR